MIGERALEEVRDDVRAFLHAEFDAGSFQPRCDAWLYGNDPEFSRKLAEHGWIGMTWPRRYGGHERSTVERFVVTEELLAAGAPIAGHWMADRQIGPNLLRFGSADHKETFLPAIAAGTTSFCIGLSEPDSGSDLASIRCRAQRVRDGWKINGTKLWTTGAHIADFMMALVRTAGTPDDRQHGLSQLVVDLSGPGIEVRPIESMGGARHFNEVVFTDALVPEHALVGTEGEGWAQATAELALERSGPERLMSTLPLLLLWAQELRDTVEPGDEHLRALGGLMAQFWTLRQMSLSVARSMADQDSLGLRAAVVKDLGTRFEREVIEVVRRHDRVEPDPESSKPLPAMLAEAVLQAPAFSLRGGTTEILRGIVARGLGVR